MLEFNPPITTYFEVVPMEKLQEEFSEYYKALKVVPTKKNSTIQIRVQEDLHIRAKEIAYSKDLSLNQWVINAMIEKINNDRLQESLIDNQDDYNNSPT